MKLRSVISIVLVFIMNSIYAQNYFYKTYSGGMYDVGQGVCELPDEDYAVTGSSSSSSSSHSQAFLMIVDSLGNQKWTKFYGEDGDNWGRRVFHKQNEGFWIMGYSNAYGDGDFDFTVWKIDENGVLEWTKTMGTSDWDRLYDVVELANGDFILVGEVEGDGAQGSDIYMCRITSSGDLVWSQQIENEGSDAARAVKSLNDTTVFIAGGYAQGSDVEGLIVDLHIDGNINQLWTYSDYDSTVFRGIDFYDDEIYVCGSGQITSPDYVNSLVLRFDMGYNQISSEIGNSEEDDFGTNILVMTNDKVYWTIQTVAPFHNPFPGGWDAFIYRYHQQLYFLGPSYRTSGFDDDIYHQLIETSDGGYIAVGLCSDDRFNISSGKNVMLVKVGPNDESEQNADEGSDFLALTENFKNTKDYIYPNPARKYIYIPEAMKNAKVVARNLMGERVNVNHFDDKIDVSSLSQGIYIFDFYFEDTKKSFRIIKE